MYSCLIGFKNIFGVIGILLYFVKSQREQKTITTTLLSNNAAQGLYWDVETSTDLIINYLAFNTNGCTGTYETRLYKRKEFGGYSGFENNPDAWELLIVDELGCLPVRDDEPNLEIEVIPDCFVPENTRQAFHLYIVPNDATDETVSLIMGNQGDLIVINPDIAVYTGTIIDEGGNEFTRTTDTRGIFILICIIKSQNNIVYISMSVI